MAAETPVLERSPEDKLRMPFSGNRSYEDCFDDEKEHNANIRSYFLKLIDPDSTVDDVFGHNEVKDNAPEEESFKETHFEKAEIAPAPAVREAAYTDPYLVKNARADSVLFNAESAINRIKRTEMEEFNVANDANSADSEEENEDLRPTPTTIQYKTIDKANAKSGLKSSTGKKTVLGKKEIIIIAVVVTVIVALLALVILNSTIIAGLNRDIAAVQNDLTAARAALAGVNASISDMVPETVRDLLIK